VSTIFLGIDFTKEKFTHRTVRWRSVSSYQQRQIFRAGECVDLVKYEIPAVFPASKGKKLIWFSDLHFKGHSELEEKILEECLDFSRDINPEYIDEEM
jgi:hypothetical protein